METVTFGHLSDVSWMGIPFVMSLTTMRGREQYGCCLCLVLCPPRMRLRARNGLVNEVEFLGLIPQNGGRPMRLQDR